MALRAKQDDEKTSEELFDRFLDQMDLCCDPPDGDTVKSDPERQARLKAFLTGESH